MAVRLAISIGDYNGVGPEVVLRTLADTDLAEVTPVILSDEPVLDFYADRLGIRLPWRRAGSAEEIAGGQINVLPCFSIDGREVRPGELDRHAGACAMASVDRGIALCMEGKADALVTAPISKEAVNMAGYHIPGHTEYLAEQTGADRVMMMLVSGPLRVGLVTGHIPLKEVSSRLSQEELTRSIETMNRSLSADFGIPSPRLAVLGLNPHAGDGGVMGREEIDTIAPAIRAAAERGIAVSGPHPADGFFGSRAHESVDGVLAIYHDQGLVPFKALSFGRGVNFTAGLPIIRTSPDHGTAFDIAGTGEADTGSFAAACELARTLATNRKRRFDEQQ